MKTFNLASTLLSASLLFLTTQLNAEPSKMVTPALDSSDLVVVDAVSYKVERKSVHFSQKIAKNSKLSLQPQSYTSGSDEYWFEVTAQQLNAGVGLAISSQEALIRLSSKKIQRSLVAPKAIDPNDVELYKNKNVLLNPFNKMVSQQQLATANIFPNSSALKLDKSVGTGEFTLKVKQVLDAQQSYLINVKEKNSDHKLYVSIDNQSYLAGDQVTFTANMTNKNKKLADSSQQIFIQLPSGEKRAVELNKKGGKYQFTAPENLTGLKRGELVELFVESEVLDNGLKVKRNGKVAFAIAQPTARIVGDAFVKKSSAKVKLEVASEGRYEISGLVYGTNKSGTSVPIMLSRSAYYLAAGQHKVALKFDRKLLRKSGLKAPYLVKELRLMDQSRMALLQQF